MPRKILTTAIVRIIHLDIHHHAHRRALCHLGHSSSFVPLPQLFVQHKKSEHQTDREHEEMTLDVDQKRKKLHLH